MAIVGSWIRECDDALFRRFFEKRPELKLLDARVEAVDPASLDALLVTGGEDISAPYLKQQIPDPLLIEEPQPKRDEWEFEAVRVALEAGKPILAVCKGHQVLNVAMGGTLYLDIKGHNLPELKTNNVQPLRHSAGAKHRFELVNSSHHQAIDRLGEGLEIEAWCANDDVIEQVRIRDYPFGLGVQFHPERDWLYESLFTDFFDHIKQ